MMTIAFIAVGALIFLLGVLVGAVIASGSVIDRMERDRAIRVMQQVEAEMANINEHAEAMAAFNASQN